MLVRKLTEEDGEALWALRLRALTDNPEAFATTYEETLASGQERLFDCWDTASFPRSATIV